MVFPLPDDAVMAAAVFGKLPAHGDFVTRGLVATERDAIDAWLATSLAEARTALGEDFDAIYDHAPPWRFTTADGARGAAGALAPSVDAVGRRFPILILRDDLPTGAVMGAAQACETLLFDALAEGWDVDRLQSEVAAVSPEAGDDRPHEPRWWTDGGENFPPAALPGHRPAAILRSVLTMESSQ